MFNDFFINIIIKLRSINCLKKINIEIKLLINAQNA